jgi:hypothetical protein
MEIAAVNMQSKNNIFVVLLVLCLGKTVLE